MPRRCQESRVPLSMYSYIVLPSLGMLVKGLPTLSTLSSQLDSYSQCFRVSVLLQTQHLRPIQQHPTGNPTNDARQHLPVGPHAPLSVLLFSNNHTDQLSTTLSRRNLPLLALMSLGGLYLGFKSRTIMLKRQQRSRREGEYGVEIHRSGMFVCV